MASPPLALSPNMKKIKFAAAILAATTVSLGAIAPAKAVVTGCAGGNSGMAMWSDITATPGFTCVIGDKTYSNFTYSGTKLDTGSSVFSGIDNSDVFQFSTIGALGLVHNLNIQSANSFQNSTILLNYNVAITSGTNTLMDYSGNITGDNGTQWALSLASTNAPGSPSQTTGYPTLAQVATTPDVSFTAGSTSTDVANTFAANAAGNGVTQFSNRVTQKTTVPPTATPGPLPLLGAGAAFGFSRRIRSRIKFAA